MLKVLLLFSAPSVHKQLSVVNLTHLMNLQTAIQEQMSLECSFLGADITHNVPCEKKIEDTTA